MTNTNHEIFVNALIDLCLSYFKNKVSKSGVMNIGINMITKRSYGLSAQIFMKLSKPDSSRPSVNLHFTRASNERLGSRYRMQQPPDIENCYS